MATAFQFIDVKEMNEQKETTFFRSIKRQLVIWFLILALAPLIVASLLTYFQARSTLRVEVFNTLKVLQEAKKEQVRDYFNEREADLMILSKAQSVSGLLRELLRYYNTMDHDPMSVFPTGTAEYKQIDDEYGGYLRDFAQVYQYYDVLLIGAAHGHVMFSVAKENDLGENLSTGELRNNPLARLWRKVIQSKQVSIEDFAPYAPSENVAAGFMGIPLYDKGEMAGVLAVQAIRTLAESVAESAQSASQIAVSAKQQLVGVDQVAIAMESIKEASEQNVTITKQSSEAAKNLTELSGKLKGLTERYQL